MSGSTVPEPVTEVHVRCPCGMNFEIRQAPNPFSALELARILWATHIEGHEAEAERAS